MIGGILIRRLVLPICVGFGLAGVYNAYLHHNISYETHNKRVMEKVDGIFSHTEIEIDKRDGDVKVVRYDLLNYRSYFDEDEDLKVDEVYLGDNMFIRGSHSKFFQRDKHFNENSEVFNEADKEFRKQIKRFGE